MVIKSNITVIMHPSRMSIGIMMLWIVVLLSIIYIILCVRYHYRVSDEVTLLQCDHNTFDAQMLRERLPIVCSGFEHTRVFSTLQDTNGLSKTPTTVENTIYSHFQHIRPWWSTPQPIRNIQVKHNHTRLSAVSKTSSHIDVYTQCISDVCMLIQTHGTSSVWLIHPTHKKESSPESTPYTEVILRSGTCIFVPFLWWYVAYENPNTPYDNSDARDPPNSQRCEIRTLQWKSALSTYVPYV